MQNQTEIEPCDPIMVADRLIALRHALELSKSEFARMIEVDKSSYTKIEKGEKPIQTRAVYRIFKLYGVDPNFIYLGQIGGLPSSLSKKIMIHLKG